jgi:hypothetical protein
MLKIRNFEKCFHEDNKTNANAQQIIGIKNIKITSNMFLFYLELTRDYSMWLNPVYINQFQTKPKRTVKSL